MQLHLLIPGLLWPAAAQPGAARHPGLAWLLGRGRQDLRPFAPATAQLAGLFGLTPDAVALAAMRRLGEPGLPPPQSGTHWLCADPVHLSFAREHLLLGELGEDAPDAAETAALIEALNATFADLGQFEAATPRRWYLRLARPTHARLYPLDDVVGRPIKHFLPEGEDARLWQRTLNEAQIVLHNHPLNEARVAAGRRPINSLWLWGAGAPDAAARAALPAIQARDVLARGFARAAGLSATAPELAQALRADTLVVLDELHDAARELDLARWQAALDALEAQWFAPLAQALRAGRLGALRLTAGGDRATLELDVRATDRWRFWRAPQGLDTLLRSLAPPPPALPNAPATASDSGPSHSPHR